jgi:hypothetical protein
MKVQIINNKIVAIGDLEDNGKNEVFDIDENILPRTEEGNIDYGLLFSQEFKHNELLDSDSFNLALNNYLTASYNGSVISNSSEFQSISVSSDSTGSEGATGSTWPAMIVVQYTNTSPQSIGVSYTTLTNMSASLSTGTYVVNFSGNFTLSGNAQASITMFVDNTEVGSTNGYTYREFGTIASNGSNDWIGSVHTQGFITITGTQIVDIRGKYTTAGISRIFNNGSMIIIKIT